jgi:uncharacterized repeat protein (TIGR04076 family)
MKRKEFICKTSCGMAGLMSASVVLDSESDAQSSRKYRITVDIYEARQDTWCHRKGDKFDWPQDMGKICPWLRSSMHDAIRLLENGVTLTWKYENTPYQKVIDPDGITTEFIRCPDPTSNLVARITRTKV